MSLNKEERAAQEHLMGEMRQTMLVVFNKMSALDVDHTKKHREMMDFLNDFRGAASAEFNGIHIHLQEEARRMLAAYEQQTLAMHQEGERTREAIRSAVLNIFGELDYQSRFTFWGGLGWVYKRMTMALKAFVCRVWHHSSKFPVKGEVNATK